jgi:hypothetical protein
MSMRAPRLRLTGPTRRCLDANILVSSCEAIGEHGGLPCGPVSTVHVCVYLIASYFPVRCADAARYAYRMAFRIAESDIASFAS